MGPTRSVHDNHVYAISIALEVERLILHTVFRDREPVEYTDVTFSGVVAHNFRHALRGNILFDVTEGEVQSLIHAEAELLKESWRYGWPEVEYKGDLDRLIEALRNKSIRAYSIDSSYGLSGWVLAVDCHRIPRDKAYTVP
jgi:hypothetical protein